MAGLFFFLPEKEMVSADMCEHDWPGSGCPKCRDNGNLDAPRTKGAQSMIPADREAILRDPLALAMLAAWLNVPIDKLPAELNAHTCEATMKAWKRVGDAALDFLTRTEAMIGEVGKHIASLRSLSS